jgi:hypothetical protein
MPQHTHNLEALDKAVPQGKSPARVAAGQRNGRLAVGKKSESGRAASAQNARKHGLFSRQFCVLSTESAEFFADFRDQLFAELAPVTPLQYRLAESIVQYSWTLERNFALEVTALNHEIANQQKLQQGRGESSSPEATTFLAFDTLAQRNSTLTLIYRQRAQLERQLARTRKEYNDSLQKDESAAHTSYIPPLPTGSNPMFRPPEPETEIKVEPEGQPPPAQEFANEGNELRLAPQPVGSPNVDSCPESSPESPRGTLSDAEISSE